MNVSFSLTRRRPRIDSFIVGLLAVVWLVNGESTAADINSTWLGINGNWNDAANWNPNQVPNNSPPDTFNVTFNSATAALDSNIAINKFTFDGGSLVRGGGPAVIELKVQKKMTWTSGAIGENVAVITNGGLTIGPQGATPPELDGTLINNSAAMLSGTTLTAPATGSGSVVNNGSFSVQANSGIAGQIFFNNLAGGKFTKLVGGGATPITIGGSFRNEGRVDVKTGGILAFNDFEQVQGTTFVESGAILKSDNDLVFLKGRLTGLGIVQAPNVINGGKLKATLANNAKLEIRTNSYDGGETLSLFESNVGGPGWDPDYASLVHVTGDVLLGGRLLIRVWPGYTPNPTFEYYIMTTDGTLSGSFLNAFDGQRINTVGRQGSFVVRYGSPGYEHEVSLEDWGPAVVPEPAGLSLVFLSGVIAGPWVRRRATK